MQGLVSQANDFLDRSKHEANLRLTHAAQTLPPTIMEQFNTAKESFIAFFIALFAIFTVFVGRFVDYVLDIVFSLRQGKAPPMLNDALNMFASIARFVIGSDRYETVQKVLMQLLHQQPNRPSPPPAAPKQSARK